jgi:serine-type D-Ala-D-Ala carboxypeptidase (penicillin-binding protein 5/6)
MNWKQNDRNMHMHHHKHDLRSPLRALLHIAVCLIAIHGFAVAATAAETAVPAAPTGNAKAYLLMDAHSGHYLASFNIDALLEPASLVKMMTVFVAGQEIKAGRIFPNDMVRVSEKAWRMKGSRMYLDLGSSVSVADLLHGIIIQSGNDAAVALAEHVSGSEPLFVQLMNQTAQELGMTRTRFSNATGMPSPETRTTARDLALLSAALIRDHPDLYSLHAVKEFEHNGIKQYNRNRLLHRDMSVDGIKTGYTRNAGYCQATSAQRGEMRLIAVVLGAETIAARTRLNQALLEYGFTHYETRRLQSRGQAIGSIKVWKAREPEIVYGVARDIYLTLPKGGFEHLEQDISLSLSEPAIGPVHKNQTIGTLRISMGAQVLAHDDLVALTEAHEAGLISLIFDSVRLLLFRRFFL